MVKKNKWEYVKVKTLSEGRLQQKIYKKKGKKLKLVKTETDKKATFWK